MSNLIKPENIDDWVNFGINLREQNKYKDSIEAILNGLRMKNRTNKQYARGFSELARTYLAMGLFNEAHTAIKQGMQWDSENIDYKNLNEKINNSRGKKEQEILEKINEIKDLIQKFYPKEAIKKMEEVKSVYDLIQFREYRSFIETNTVSCENYSKAISILKSDIPLIYEEIPVKDLKDKIRLSEGILLSERILKEMVIQLIKQGEIRAKLRGETLVYIPEDKTIEILEDIKDNTEIIRTYSEKIEDILNKQDNLEEYLRSNLSTDFEKIKEAWEDYKEGNITKKGLIKEAIKVLGKKFIKIVLKS